MRLLWLLVQVIALLVFLAFLGVTFLLTMLRLFVLGVVEFMVALGD